MLTYNSKHFHLVNDRVCETERDGENSGLDLLESALKAKGIPSVCRILAMDLLQLAAHHVPTTDSRIRRCSASVA